MGLRYAKLDDSDGCITRPQARTGWAGTDEPVQVRVRVPVGEPRVTRSGEGSWAGLARPLPESRLRLPARPRNRLAPGGCGCQSGGVTRTSPLRARSSSDMLQLQRRVAGQHGKIVVRLEDGSAMAAPRVPSSSCFSPPRAGPTPLAYDLSGPGSSATRSLLVRS